MICDFPDAMLFEKCAWIDPASRLCRKIVTSLRVEMLSYRRQGVGLASPQIGFAYRVFVMDNRFLGINGSSAFINPEITWRSQESETEKEGCLSFPSIVQIPVTRNASIEISAFDVNGKEFKKSLNGLAARCFQHEQDHLDGITLWHHATEKSKKRISELAAVGGDEEWQRSRNQDS